MAYIKETFDPVSLEHAKDIVLSPDEARPNKFEEETDFLVQFIKEHALITTDSRVLDFGCGMGRISKKLIETFGCRVIGTDISRRMLEFAEMYVGYPLKFEPELSYKGHDIDVIIASLVLQHTEDPKKEIAALFGNLKSGGSFVLLDDGKRFVPVDVDRDRYVIWNDDGIKILDIMAEYFTNVGYYPYCDRSDTPLSIWKKA